jgi:hypothetical protein
LICLVGIGFWLGWFSFSSSPSPDTDSNKVNVNVSVDKGKIRSDVVKVEEKVKQLAGKAKTQEAKWNLTLGGGWPS